MVTALYIAGGLLATGLAVVAGFSCHYVWQTFEAIENLDTQPDWED